MPTNNEGGNRAKTVEHAFKILERLKAEDGLSLKELTEKQDKSKSSIHRYLSTLEDLEYVVKENGEYYPSLQFLDYGEYIRKRKLGYNLAREKVNELSEETGERVQFTVEEHGKGVYMYRSSDSRAIRTDHDIGKRVYLHAVAGGKAILAEKPDDAVEDIIDKHGLPKFTSNTITEPTKLFDELETIRERGYSFNLEESLEGLHAVGVAFQNPRNQVIGAISISGPSHRLKGARFKEEIPDKLLEAANELELNIVQA